MANLHVCRRDDASHNVILTYQEPILENMGLLGPTNSKAASPRASSDMVEALRLMIDAMSSIITIFSGQAPNAEMSTDEIRACESLHSDWAGHSAIWRPVPCLGLAMGVRVEAGEAAGRVASAEIGC